MLQKHIFSSATLFPDLNASEEAGKIVVAIEIEIINGNLDIGSAAAKKSNSFQS